jgi:hypothetical protein
MLNLYAMKSGEGSELMLSSAVGTAGAQALAGVAAIVMGILALAGNQPMSLALVALLILGAAILVTGNGISKAAVHVFSRFPSRA